MITQLTCSRQGDSSEQVSDRLEQDIFLEPTHKEKITSVSTVLLANLIFPLIRNTKQVKESANELMKVTLKAFI